MESQAFRTDTTERELDHRAYSRKAVPLGPYDMEKSGLMAKPLQLPASDQVPYQDNPNYPIRHPGEQLLALGENVEQAAGGRAAVVAYLSQLNLNAQQEILVKLLADPRRQKTPLSKICGMAGVSLGRFMQMMQQASTAFALMEAHNKIAQYTAAVAEDTMKQALADPAVERQELALRIAGVIKPAAGQGTQVNIQTNIGSVLTTSPDFRKATDRLLYPAKYSEEPVEAEVTEK